MPSSLAFSSLKPGKWFTRGMFFQQDDAFFLSGMPVLISASVVGSAQCFVQTSMDQTWNPGVGPPSPAACMPRDLFPNHSPVMKLQSPQPAAVLRLLDLRPSLCLSCLRF